MRFLYAGIAVILWMSFLAYAGVFEIVSDEAMLIALSLVAAGGLAGGA